MLLALLLAGCAGQTAPVAFPPIGFTDRPLLPLEVARIDVIDEYVPPGRPPHVDHLFPVPPREAAHAWARDRLQPTGSADRVARFIIGQASAIETRLPRSGGVRGAFTTEQSERYDVVIEARLELRGGDGRQEGFVTAQVQRSRTVGEDITPDERKRAWYYLTVDAMREFDGVMETQIRNELGRYLR